MTHEKAVEVPEEFVESVRDALIHLYDVGYLQAHPLAAAPAGAEASPAARGKLLRQALLGAIESYRPAAGVASTSRAWRVYNILELRYVEGHEVAEVVRRVALGRSQYHREHQYALHGLAGLLWDSWRMAERWRPPDQPPPAGGTDGTSASADELARLEVGSLAAEGTSGRADARELLEGVCGLLQPLGARRGVGLRVALAEQLPCIRGDRVALRQALLAILADAIKVGEPDSDVDVAVDVQSDGVVVHVWGIAGTAFPAGQPASGEAGPFVAALRGRLTCQPPTDLPGGWYLELALQADDSPVLLVVDNSSDFVSLVGRYLAGHNWRVVGATGVEQARLVVRKRPPRAILLDVIMPGQDGWELLQELKTTPSTRDIPVILCSVLREPEVAISLGATTYLQKPVGQTELLGALEAFE